MGSYEDFQQWKRDQAQTSLRAQSRLLLEQRRTQWEQNEQALDFIASSEAVTKIAKGLTQYDYASYLNRVGQIEGYNLSSSVYLYQHKPAPSPSADLAVSQANARQAMSEQLLRLGLGNFPESSGIEFFGDNPIAPVRNSDWPTRGRCLYDEPRRSGIGVRFVKVAREKREEKTFDDKIKKLLGNDYNEEIEIWKAVAYVRFFPDRGGLKWIITCGKDTQTIGNIDNPRGFGETLDIALGSPAILYSSTTKHHDEIPRPPKKPFFSIRFEWPEQSYHQEAPGGSS